MDAKPTVLVCDDDRLVLATTVAGLRDSGYDVIEADNGDDAILLARQHRPRLALLDIRMDGKSGLDVARYLRDHVGTPFMFLSAFSDTDTVTQARALGALDYLVKPLDTRQIVQAVESALQAPACEPGSDAAAGAQGRAHEPAQEPAHELAPLAASPRVPRPAAAPVAAQASAHGSLAADAQRTGIAIGILMERYSVGEDEARARLAAWAARSGRSEAALADELVRQTDGLNAVASR